MITVEGQSYTNSSFFPSIPHLVEKVQKYCPTMLGFGYFLLTNYFVLAKPNDIWMFLSSPTAFQ